MDAFVVFFGGGAGALARHFMGLAISRRVGGHAFPWHTLSINLLGSFLIGVLAEFFALRMAWPENVRLLLVTGFLGGFTTFSSFALENALMAERGDYAGCAGYVAASVIGGITLVFAGMAAMRMTL